MIDSLIIIIHTLAIHYSPASLLFCYFLKFILWEIPTSKLCGSAGVWCYYSRRMSAEMY